MDGVLGLTDGIDIEGTHDLGCNAWLTIDDTHHLTASRSSGIGLQSFETCQRTTIVVFHTADILVGGAIPNLHEDALQLIDGITLYATVHIAPFTHLFSTFDIVVCHIHTSRISDAPVDNDYLTMVTAIDVVDPRETDRAILNDVDAVIAQRLEVVFLEWLVVGVIAETIEHGTNLYTLTTLLAQDVKQQ